MTKDTIIYEIICREMEGLLDTMVTDFSTNYDKKENNWILSGFDNIIVSNMVFVSSFESKYGNMFENIIREIVKLNYGENNTPYFVKGVGIDEEEYEFTIRTISNRRNKNNKRQDQVIISKFDKKANDGILSQFRASRIAQGNGKKRIPSRLTQSEMPKLLNENITCSNDVYIQPVDLMFYDESDGKYKLFEIKAGGDLDSSNAPKNIEKMLKIYSCLGKENSNLYFATLYNKNGEGKNWTGAVKKHISEDSMLIGKDFWNMILKDITFEEYLEIYKAAFNDTGFNDVLSDLITNTAKI